MSTSAEQINDLIGGYTDLKTYFEAQRDDWEARVAASEAASAAHISASRQENGHICFTPNQAMTPNGTNDGVENLSHGGLDLNISEHANITLGGASGQATANATNFLNDIQQAYSNKPFKVLDVTWNVTGLGRFHDLRPTGPATHAAYIKPINTANGTIGGAGAGLAGSFIERASLNNGWGLWGAWDAGALLAAHAPLVLTGSGQMLIALYGSVTGFADLENNKWTKFPYLAV